VVSWLHDGVRRTWSRLSRRVAKWGYRALGLITLGPLATFLLIALPGYLAGVDCDPLLEALWRVFEFPLGWAALAAYLTLALAGFLRFVNRTVVSKGQLLRFWEGEQVIELQKAGKAIRLPVTDVESAYYVYATRDPGKQSSSDGATADKEHGLGNLVLELRGRDELSISLPPQSARAFLNAAQLGPRHQAHQIKGTRIPFWSLKLLNVAAVLASAAVSALCLLTALTFTLEVAPGPLLGLAAPLILVLWPLATSDFKRSLSELLVGQDINLGNDGIQWGSQRSPHFVAYADIESLEVDRGGDHLLSNHTLLIHTRHGQTLDIPLRGFADDAADIVQERLRGILERSDSLLMPQLSRDGRSDAEWRDALRSLVSLGGDYRRAPVTKERVKELLRDPDSPMEQRLRAAVALIETEDPEAHRILVQVSEATADPELQEPIAQLVSEAEAFVEVPVPITNPTL